MKLLTSEEVSKMLKVTIVTLSRWRSSGKGPPFIRLEGEKGTVLYRESDIEEYLNDRRIIPSEDIENESRI